MKRELGIARCGLACAYVQKILRAMVAAQVGVRTTTVVRMKSVQ